MFRKGRWEERNGKTKETRKRGRKGREPEGNAERKGRMKEGREDGRRYTCRGRERDK